MILRGKEADQKLDEIFREKAQNTIAKFKNPSDRLNLGASEVQNTLTSIADRGDSETMRALFDAFYSYKLRVSPPDSNPDEIRKHAL